MSLVGFFARAVAERTTDPARDDIEERILVATLRQMELYGLKRTTMEDVARRAKVSRVTLYRRFAGKDALLEAVFLREVSEFLAELDLATSACSRDEDRIVVGFAFTLESIRSHPLLNRLLTGEPDSFLPQLVAMGGPLVDVARDYLATQMVGRSGLSRGDDDELTAMAEIVVRLLLSFVLIPGSRVDLEDPERARRFARRYLVPLFEVATCSSGEPSRLEAKGQQGDAGPRA
ncbi:TetR/AcrR family transcriptional regulator [Acidiferrimicrobium sp. IK]|uniref:TetR/AcrR family transcriptional regulator n=1 Tax=Acidiferrimicrobium sp. IK TaxID=2871700 RepID=UPI0021CB031C|nr:TetR/AcrR family transcriptional regulator [Acidiferrimicrobium sp. IK]MCU4187399.1 TetR/AcrR family transcriptional regulator [Acidiferrimicrobium sp. IK]